MDALVPEPPPVRGDHRHTWLGLLVFAVLFTSSVWVAILVAPR